MVNLASPTRESPTVFVRIVADYSLEHTPCSAQTPDRSSREPCALGSGSPTNGKSWRKGHLLRNCPLLLCHVHSDSDENARNQLALR